MTVLLVALQMIATYAPQPPDPRLPAITPYAVSVCVSAPQPQSFPAGKLYEATLGHFTFVAPAEVRRVANAKRQRSFPYTASIAGEILAWGATAALASDALKINEQAKALIPTAAAGLDLARRLLSREFQAWELPPNTAQGWLAIPPGGCAETVIFGRTQQGEQSFRVEVK